MEIWKDINGYEGIYQISNTGRLKSLKRLFIRKNNINPYNKEEIILKLQNNGKGYLFIRLSKNSKHKYYYIHRLVALHFIDNPSNKPAVNHKDGNKSNNNVNNLEWVTNSENQIHALETGLLIPKGAVGIKNTKSKLTDNDILIIREKSLEGIRGTDIAKIFNVCKTTISGIKNNKTWKHIK